MEVIGYRLRQVRVSEKVYQQLKAFCKDRHLKMIEFYDQCLNWFLMNCHKPIFYHASCKNGHQLSLWLRETHIEQIKTLAKCANVSEARVVFTALMSYLEKRSLDL
jgi:hypothetical protein